MNVPREHLFDKSKVRVIRCSYGAAVVFTVAYLQLADSVSK